MPRRASEQATWISPRVRGDLGGSRLRRLNAPALQLVSLHLGYGIQVAAEHPPHGHRVQTHPRCCLPAPLLRTLEVPLFARKVRSFFQHTQSSARCKLAEYLYASRAINGYDALPINYLRSFKLRHLKCSADEFWVRLEPTARA
jgi:hypothetical protein